MSRQVRLTMMLALMAASVGCGGADRTAATTAAAPAASTTATTSAPAPAQRAAGNTATVPPGIQQLAPPGRTPPLVAGDRLQTLLPEVGGWERQTPTFHEQSMGVASFSIAEARYRAADAEVTLAITDSAMNQLLLAPLTGFIGTGYSERHTNGYTKAISISGAPAFEKWEQDSHHAEVTAIVGNRFIVGGKGHGVTAPDVVRKIVEAVNLTKLAELR